MCGFGSSAHTPHGFFEYLAAFVIITFDLCFLKFHHPITDATTTHACLLWLFVDLASNSYTHGPPIKKKTLHPSLLQLSIASHPYPI